MRELKGELRICFTLLTLKSLKEKDRLSYFQFLVGPNSKES